MMQFKERSYQKEILDSDNIPFADIKQNMKELNTINTLLGGHAITIAGVKKIIKKETIQNQITICEIGCGGGDNLQAINKWCLKNKIVVNFIGIDIKQECIDFAMQQYPSLNCEWICSSYQLTNFSTQPDIIFSSLFCHHFTNDELVFMLAWMNDNCTKGFFINDLHRHFLAYYSILFITSIFSKSYLVKHDAPLSVARSFTKKDWQNILAETNLQQVDIKWKWAFRYLLTYTHVTK
jgi:2-polyprenyl-3-methyl-5-hydroxy-6-metoxy-1,4-benzoquinol methylase